MFRLFIIAHILFICLANTAFAERLAFVVGIADYKSIPGVTNAATDAQKIAQKLIETGYETTVASTADKTTKENLLKLWSAFEQKLDSEDVVILYYSGYGVQIGGENFIVPSDSPPPVDVKDRKELIPHFLPFRQLGTDVAARQVKMQIWLVDAARNDPYVNEKTPTTDKGGLAPGDRQHHKFAIYSTMYGQVGSEKFYGESGDALGSPFTRVFLSLFDEWKDKRLIDFARYLRLKVLEETHGELPTFEVDTQDGFDWCFVECVAGGAMPKVDLHSDNMVHALRAILHSYDESTLSNNVVYLGKKSASESCGRRPGGGNAYPYGCELLKRLVENTRGETPILNDADEITAGVTSNVRKGLPRWWGYQALYQCSVASAPPGTILPVKFIQPYETNIDVYYWGIIDGIPKTACID